MQVLVVDNYDSFVFNLVQYLGQLGVDAQVWRNDDDRLATDADIAAAATDFDGVLLSPGPGTPGARRRVHPIGESLRRGQDSTARGVPGASGDRGGVRWHRRPGPGVAAR